MSRTFEPQAAPNGVYVHSHIPGYGITEASGTVVPTDGSPDYAPGCTFRQLDGAAGTAVYVNEGTASSCDFNPVAGNGVTGVGGGYKVARGTATLDGSNPTTVATGLTTIVAAVVGLKSATAPGDDPSWLSHNYTGSDGNLDIYAWKNTGGTDPTLVASTNNTATVDWIAVGT